MEKNNSLNNPNEQENRKSDNDDDWETDQDNESDEDRQDIFEDSYGEENEDLNIQQKNGCRHYIRKCEKRCPECLEFFPCRLCHDLVKFEKELDPKKNHQFKRHEVTEIKCLVCQHIQKPQKNCEKCNIEFAGYFCKICILFDDKYQEKQIYHCEECGICRVGGKEDSFHCKICECCYALDQKDNHTCIPQKLKQDCAVCMNDMQSSVRSLSILKCGHAMHAICFAKYYKNGEIACPLCKKSIVDPKLYEQEMDQQIADYKMPKEHRKQKMLILCNDCLERSMVKFHFLGGKCKSCKSYNTNRIDNAQEIEQFKQKQSKDKINKNKN